MEGDIGDHAILEAGLEGVDIVFHLASALGSSLISKREFQRVNVQGSVALLKAARAKGVTRFIHVSSAGVLGSVKATDAVDETFPPRPASVYDQTKLEAERAALDFSSGAMDVVVVRPGWAYGPRDRRTFKLIKAIHKRRLVVMPKGKALQTPVYIDDLVQGMLLAARSGRKGEIYHVAGKEILSSAEIVTAIARACRKKRPLLILPLVPSRLAAMALETAFALFRKEAPFSRSKLSFFIHSKPLSVAKAREELGYVPEFDFERGLQLTVSWYRKAGWL